jgi:hypothetical protein
MSKNDPETDRIPNVDDLPGGDNRDLAGRAKIGRSASAPSIGKKPLPYGWPTKPRLETALFDQGDETAATGSDEPKTVGRESNRRTRLKQYARLSPNQSRSRG